MGQPEIGASSPRCETTTRARIRTGHPGGSVTRWVHDLKEGDRLRGLRAIWKQHLPTADRAGQRQAPETRASCRRRRWRGRGPERAFQSLCDGAPGRFDRLGDRDDLWRLLVVIASHLQGGRPEAARPPTEAPGGGRVLAERRWSKRTSPDPGTGRRSGDRIPSDEPTPEFAAMLAEEYQRRLNSLGKEEAPAGCRPPDGGLQQRGDRRPAQLRPSGPWPDDSK